MEYLSSLPAFCVPQFVYFLLLLRPPILEHMRPIPITLSGVEYGTNRNVDFAFTFDFCTQWDYVAPFGRNTQRGNDKETKRSQCADFRVAYKRF